MRGEGAVSGEREVWVVVSWEGGEGGREGGRKRGGMEGLRRLGGKTGFTVFEVVTLARTSSDFRATLQNIQADQRDKKK